MEINNDYTQGFSVNINKTADDEESLLEKAYKEYTASGDSVSISKEAFALYNQKMAEYDADSYEDLSDDEKADLRQTLSEAGAISRTSTETGTTETEGSKL